MKKHFVSLLCGLLAFAFSANAELLQYSPSTGGGGSSVTWPTTGSAVISNGTNTPAGVAEVDDACLVGISGAWAAGSCSTGSGGDTITSPNSTLTVGGTPTNTTLDFNLSHANTWAAVQTFTNSDFALLGSSTGKTTLTSDNAGASNFTMHLPAANDTLAAIAATQTLTNKDLTSGTNTFPTLNQNTSGSAAKWTTARNLAGNSVDGSANVAFANKFIVQGTSDSGLSGPQFLGALSTGILKNTTSTGVLSNAAAADVVALFSTCSGSQYLGADGACHNASGAGTVTSVTFTGDGTVLSSTPSSAVTTSGTVAGTLANGAAGTVLGNATSSAAAPTYTSSPQLGKSGTLGAVVMGNSTSGLLTLQPAAGALGTPTVLIPAASDTLVNLAGTQTLSNKTFVAPALGTPASGVATNLTGTASGLTAGNVTINANLTGVINSSGNTTSITSQTGTGSKFVVDTSPTLVTPNIGVASATSLATSAASPLLLTNGQLVTVALTSQTTGGTTLTIPDFASVVDEFTFKTKSQTMSNKTFVAPVLGAATATSINKMAITAPATSSTLAVADGKTATISNTLTFTGTDSSSVAFGAGGTVLYPASAAVTSAVAITGGAIDGVTIGATTPVVAQVQRPVNTQTGTSYTLLIGDQDKMITLNNASAVTLTIPANASVAFPVGTEIDLLQLGAGQVNVVITTDTLQSYTAKTHLAGQYAGGTLKKIGTTTWVLIGNLS